MNRVDDNARDLHVDFPAAANGSGPVMKLLRKTLTDIQTGAVEGPEGWVVEIANA